ncbi:unnamed protein product [Diabrotica balteata]|uniref:Uncharacterized protein n=1 Tax=Diabrotica balteata TaxID=107213 RepID=A0A9N9T2D4_DIABA|nr:unnamed protein product [Diabrotica balteata]
MFRLVNLFFVVALVAHFASAGEPTGELAKLGKVLHIACSSKVDISEEEIGKLRVGVFTNDDKSKLKDDGDLDVDTIKEIAPAALKPTAVGVLKGCFDKQKASSYFVRDLEFLPRNDFYADDTGNISPTGERAKLAKVLHDACSRRVGISEKEIGKLKAGVFTDDDKSKLQVDGDLGYDIIEDVGPPALKPTARGVFKGCFEKQKEYFCYGLEMPLSDTSSTREPSEFKPDSGSNFHPPSDNESYTTRESFKEDGFVEPGSSRDSDLAQKLYNTLKCVFATTPMH